MPTYSVNNQTSMAKRGGAGRRGRPAPAAGRQRGCHRPGAAQAGPTAERGTTARLPPAGRGPRRIVRKREGVGGVPENPHRRRRGTDNTHRRRGPGAAARPRVEAQNGSAPTGRIKRARNPPAGRRRTRQQRRNAHPAGRRQQRGCRQLTSRDNNEEADDGTKCLRHEGAKRRARGATARPRRQRTRLDAAAAREPSTTPASPTARHMIHRQGRRLHGDATTTGGSLAGPTRPRGTA